MISIISQPSLYSPVYNPIYLEVSSTKTAQESFNFLFDLYVNGTYVNRVNLLPRPGTTRAIYSPARILESYISYDLSQNIIDEQISLNCIDKYDVKLGEEYVEYWSFNDTQFDSFSASSYTVLAGTNSATHSFAVNDYIIVENTVYGTYNAVHKIVNIPNNYTLVINKYFTSTPVNPGRATWSDKRKTESFFATQSGYAFNGVIQYEEVPVWDYTQYNLDGITKRFLTNQPDTVKTTLSDRGSIGFMNIDTIVVAPYSYVLVIGGIDLYNNPTFPIILPLSILGKYQLTNQRILEVPAGPWNLNQMTQVVYATDAISTSNKNYSLTIYKTDGENFTPMSETKTFELDHCGTRFEPVRFMFLNSLGQFDYYNATLLSRTTVATSRDTFTKTLSRDYVQGDRGKTVINVNSQENYTISTDWVSEETANWLTYEFVTSNEVYVLDNTTGKITPIVLNISDWEDKKRVNDKLLNYTITYSKAVTLNTKRN